MKDELGGARRRGGNRRFSSSPSQEVRARIEKGKKNGKVKQVGRITPLPVLKWGP